MTNKKDELNKQQSESKKNVETLHFPSFTVILEQVGEESMNLIDIELNSSKAKLSDSSIGVDDTALIFTEFIQSRLASEALVAQLSSENNVLQENNDYLLEKISKLEASLDEFRDNKED